MVSGRIFHAEHFPSIWADKGLHGNFQRADVFDALVECVQIIHLKLKMDRTVFGEGIFLTKKNQNAAGNPIFQTAIGNPIIPTVKRVQAENVLVEGFARLIVTSIGVYQ